MLNLDCAVSCKMAKITILIFFYAVLIITFMNFVGYLFKCLKLMLSKCFSSFVISSNSSNPPMPHDVHSVYHSFKRSFWLTCRTFWLSHDLGKFLSTMTIPLVSRGLLKCSILLCHLSFYEKRKMELICVSVHLSGLKFEDKSIAFSIVCVNIELWLRLNRFDT